MNRQSKKRANRTKNEQIKFFGMGEGGGFSEKLIYILHASIDFI